MCQNRKQQTLQKEAHQWQNPPTKKKQVSGVHISQKNKLLAVFSICCRNIVFVDLHD